MDEERKLLIGVWCARAHAYKMTRFFKAARYKINEKQYRIVCKKCKDIQPDMKFSPEI